MITIMDFDKQLLRQIIEDQTNYLFQEELIPRDTQIQHLPGKVTVLTGVRRSGKSSLMELIEKEYQHKFKNDHFLFLDFTDERLKGIQQEHLDLILEVFYEFKPETIDCDPLRIYFDEIQIIEGWEYFIRRLVRNKQYHIYLSGSSAKLLSKEIATELRGRSLTYEIFPFSYAEYLRARNIDRKSESTENRAKKNKALKEYLKYGSFPEVILAPQALRAKILNDYFKVLFLRDLVERHQISDIEGSHFLFKMLFSYYGSLVSINKVLKRLQTLHIHTSKQFISKFLNWAEDCYTQFTLPIETESQYKRQVNLKKLYVIDTGLISYCLDERLETMGRKIENLVFLHLRKKENHRIAYYRTKKGEEVDFIIRSSQQKIKLIQVSQTIQDFNTRKRELAALDTAMQELSLKQSWIITLDQKETIHLDSGLCYVIPLSEYLLQEED